MNDKEDVADQEQVEDLPLPTQPFESLLTDNYKLFAIIGVFGALAVYLFNLRNSAPNQFIDWGIAGSLLMFLVSSLTLVNKLSHSLVNHEDIAWLYRTFTGGILAGLIAVIYGIFGVVSQFLGEVVVLATFVVGVVVYTAYMNLFPWEKFEKLEGVSEEQKKKIKNVPHQANTWAVVAILLSGSYLPEFPKLDGYRPFLLFPAMIIGIITHFVVSFGLRKYHLEDVEKTNRG